MLHPIEGTPAASLCEAEDYARQALEHKDRLTTREVHGGEKLEEKQFMQGFIAESYMDIQAARLMTIHCAEKMEVGADPRAEISAIKVFVPNAYHKVVDRAE